jgi:LSD1 subclass zinc finger protein
MSEAKSFNCPNCGSPLMPDGTAKQVKCAFCSSIVIVPEELGDQNLNEREEKILIDDRDPFLSPHHLQWLIQNGADATAKVDSIKDKGETVVIYWSGTKATGEKFKNHAEVDKQHAAIPRRGDMIKIKYNPDDKDEIDFAFQINGRFYWDTTLWDLWSLD